MSGNGREVRYMARIAQRFISIAKSSGDAGSNRVDVKHGPIETAHAARGERLNFLAHCLAFSEQLLA